jgi:LysM repeat protein
MMATTARATMAAALLTGMAHADIDKAGTTAANFLSVGSGAGVLGMGGAVLGLGRDLSAAAWNPGALGWVNETQFVLSHSGLADAQAQEWVGAGGRLGGSTRWALTGLYHGQGSFEGRDATGASTGSFDVSSMAVGAQAAQTFGDRGTVGLGVKYVSEDLGGVRGSGVTFDVGAMLQAGRFGFGVAAQNLSGSMKYEGASYPFPTSYGMGASLIVPEQGLRFALDANFPEAYYSDLRGGVEWTWREQFALRAGYRAELGAESGEPLSGPSFGMGAGLGGVWFDYGYLISGMGSGGEHRIGMTLRPGGFNMGAFGRTANGDPDVAAERAALKRREAEAKASAQAEADKASAAKQAAVKIEAQKAEAANAEAVKLEAQKTEAAKAQAAKLEAQKAAAKAQAAQLEAQKAEAAKAQAAKLEAQKVEAAKTAAAKPAQSAQKPVAEATPPAKIPTQHRVAEGETLYRIAKLYGTTVPKIMEVNNMVNENIRVGQVLKLPKPERR